MVNLSNVRLYDDNQTVLNNFEIDFYPIDNIENCNISLIKYIYIFYFTTYYYSKYSNKNQIGEIVTGVTSEYFDYKDHFLRLNNGTIKFSAYYYIFSGVNEELYAEKYNPVIKYLIKSFVLSLSKTQCFKLGNKVEFKSKKFKNYIQSVLIDEFSLSTNNGELVDNDFIFTLVGISGEQKYNLELLYIQDDRSLYVIRHSSAHVMAQAVLNEYPDTKFAAGPPVKDGFYYDMDISVNVNHDVLNRVNINMTDIINQSSFSKVDFITSKNFIRNNINIDYLPSYSISIDSMKLAVHSFYTLSSNNLANILIKYDDFSYLIDYISDDFIGRINTYFHLISVQIGAFSNKDYIKKISIDFKDNFSALIFCYINEINKKTFSLSELSDKVIASCLVYLDYFLCIKSKVFSRYDIDIRYAIDFFKFRKDKFKLVFLDELLHKEYSVVSLYCQGNFIDLCIGPHIFGIWKLSNFKLFKFSGSYFKGDIKSDKLQRIYGASFSTKTELDQYFYLLSEAKKRSHKDLGKKLELFNFYDHSVGCVFWLDAGNILFRILKDLITNYNISRNYLEVKTPAILNKELWHKSGHMDNFRDNMYFIEDSEYAVKPMNCPGHCLMFGSTNRSYRDLPLKIAEFGYVHRNELSGVLYGLFRLRGFTQDDAHLFCKKEDLNKELTDIILYTVLLYKSLGFDKYFVSISTKPDKYIGSDDLWDYSISMLKDTLDAHNIQYNIKDKEGAFYGPKIEFNIEDSLSRMWQCGTIQVDFSMPSRFNLKYHDIDSSYNIPIILHRAILGSIERFIGILIEHYAGYLPLFLVPYQVVVISLVSKNNISYVNSIVNRLKSDNIRLKYDCLSLNLNKKVKYYQSIRIPYLILIGDNEVVNNNISIRCLKHYIGNFKETNISLKYDDFINIMKLNNYKFTNLT